MRSRGARVALLTTLSTLMLGLVVDGRQPGYRAGLTLRGAATALRGAGARDVIELDGGSSGRHVVQGRVANAPIHVRLPMNERPVASHLGLRPRRRR